MYNLQKADRVRLGDILLKLDDKFDVYESTMSFPYLIVLTQDCDLEQDYTARAKSPINHNALIDSILVAPAFVAEQVRMGTHLGDASLAMDLFGSVTKTKWDSVIKNNNPRYHYLKKEDETQLPALIIDFKRYFTLPRSKLYGDYDEHFAASINELYRELMSQRFAFYFSRVGLPEESSIS